MTTAVDCNKTYDYPSHIQQHAAVKGDNKSSVKQNINAIGGYKTILSPGNSELQLMSGALGSRDFKSTSKTCDAGGGNMVQLHQFQNHTVSCVNGTGQKKDCGLIAGLMQSVNNIGTDLGGLLHVFDISTPKCTEVTIDVVNGCMSGPQKAYIETSVAESIDPCFFTSRVNPITNAKCPVEGFETKNSTITYANYPDMPKDPLIKMYYTSIGLLMLYILMKMTIKK